MKFYSHTLVRNGQPFIGLILLQVIPFAEKCLVTISEKSDDGTIEIVQRLKEEFPDKIKISWENVETPADLTKERQKQLDKTPYGAWVLFLDDDDFWSTKSLETVVSLETDDTDIDALACNPLQVIDKQYYDLSWNKKWFTKWFKNQPGVQYRHPWPKDLIYLNDKQLYWKNNERVAKLETKYFHLSNIKYGSFRTEDWAKKYYKEIGQGYFIPQMYKQDMEKIYEYIK